LFTSDATHVNGIIGKFISAGKGHELDGIDSLSVSLQRTEDSIEIRRVDGNESTSSVGKQIQMFEGLFGLGIDSDARVGVVVDGLGVDFVLVDITGQPIPVVASRNSIGTDGHKSLLDRR